jgi:diguanylate cyclase (GGDEF)-like protein/PAS domain S-box-containing protein
MAHLSFDGRWARVNAKLCEITGYSAPELIALSFQGITHPEDVDRDLDHLQKLLTNQIESYYAEKRYIRKDGSLVWVSLQVSVVFNSDQTPAYGISIIQDISQRKKSELSAAISRQRYQALFDQMPEGILLLNDELRVIGHNEEAHRQLRFGANELLGLHISDLEAIDDEQEIAARKARIEVSGRDEFESMYRTGDGMLLDVDVSVKHVNLVNGERIFQVLFRDISEKKLAASFIEKMAYSDQLTGLANRALLSDRLLQSMAHARRREDLLAVAFLDLDGFKAINDAHGHHAGDSMLIALSSRMKDALRDGDTLARLGGDEFVIVLVDISDTGACKPLLQRLLDAAAQPVHVGGLQLHVTASLGVTFYPQEDEVNADQLMRQADQAMYQAKLAGKNRYHLFDAAHDSSLRVYHESLKRIGLALVRREFVLHYQPKVNMRSGQVIGAEALIRWQHPEKGLLPPAAFLPVIDDHPLAVEVGEWVIDTALCQIEVWHACGLNLTVSVNIGARQLQQSDFVERLQATLAMHPLVNPSSLELEVLETSALADMAQVSQVIDSCNEMGVKFALDDFGTGYSSLTYFKQLRVAMLKIDQSFVCDMLDKPEDLAILEGVIGLAGAFKREVIAEGVETVAQGAALIRLGCQLAQGYCIARPMPANQLPAWVASWKPDQAWVTPSG